MPDHSNVLDFDYQLVIWLGVDNDVRKLFVDTKENLYRMQASIIQNRLELSMIEVQSMKSEYWRKTPYEAEGAWIATEFNPKQWKPSNNHEASFWTVRNRDSAWDK